MIPVGMGMMMVMMIIVVLAIHKWKYLGYKSEE
jgi:hypothetical protein